MTSDTLDAAPEIRRPAVDLIEAVLANMRTYQEPLKYSVIVPSRYTVYVHPDEIARLDGILPLLREQTERALTEEVAKLNRRSWLVTCVDRLLVRRRPPTENAGGTWHVEFLADPDGDVARGGILVHSELLLPSAPALGPGQRTRRITTVRLGPHTTSREHVEHPPTTKLKVLARLEYEDGAGPHVRDIVNPSATIGRGGTAYPVHVPIVSSPDVSREHARIRMDAQSGHGFLTNLSSLGTTIDGQRVPRGFDERHGSRHENGIEAPLHDGARIGLADTVFLTFRIAK